MSTRGLFKHPVHRPSFRQRVMFPVARDTFFCLAAAETRACAPRNAVGFVKRSAVLFVARDVKRVRKRGCARLPLLRSCAVPRDCGPTDEIGEKQALLQKQSITGLPCFDVRIRRVRFATPLGERPQSSCPTCRVIFAYFEAKPLTHSWATPNCDTSVLRCSPLSPFLSPGAHISPTRRSSCSLG